MCREKSACLRHRPRGTGSPLRVQGKVFSSLITPFKIRITPACAGKSRRSAYKRRRTKDHPCVCREKYPTEPCGIQLIGSPLRVQGKVVTSRQKLKQTRITPACAGKSNPSLTNLWYSEDHPCVCREKMNRHFCRLICVGSPLRVQGKGFLWFKLFKEFGITPACAGKSCSSQLYSCSL